MGFGAEELAARITPDSRITSPGTAGGRRHFHLAPRRPVLEALRRLSRYPPRTLVDQRLSFLVRHQGTWKRLCSSSLPRNAQSRPGAPGRQVLARVWRKWEGADRRIAQLLPHQAGPAVALDEAVEITVITMPSLGHWPDNPRSGPPGTAHWLSRAHLWFLD